MPKRADQAAVVSRSRRPNHSQAWTPASLAITAPAMAARTSAWALSVRGIGRAGRVHADQDRGIVAVAFVQGGRDAGADRLEGAGAAAVQRGRHVEVLTDLHLAAPRMRRRPRRPGGRRLPKPTGSVT